MAKEIIKEIIIVLLLCLLIILVLGVLLYEYVPANKIIPAEVSYSTPQNVQEQLKETEEVDADKVLLTYEINQSDLYNYQRTNEYKPGKTNPFSSYESSEENTTGNTTQGGTGTSVPNPGTIHTGVNPGSDLTSNQTNTSTGTGSNVTIQNGTSGTNTTDLNTNSSGTQIVNPGNYTNKSGLK